MELEWAEVQEVSWTERSPSCSLPALLLTTLLCRAAPTWMCFTAITDFKSTLFARRPVIHCLLSSTSSPTQRCSHACERPDSRGPRYVITDLQLICQMTAFECSQHSFVPLSGG